MDKSSKIFSVILAVLAVILLVIYGVLSAVNRSVPKALEFPESGLSQSIFDSQNTKYVPNEALTGKYYFTKCPYSLDVAEVDAAKVSEYGAIYKITDSQYFYITEFGKGDNIESVIKNELSQAVMVDSNASMTAVDNYVYDEGYLNGFKADYYIDCMTVTNGTRTASVYITGYALTITDASRDHGNRMFVGVMSALNETDAYLSAKGILDSVIQTYQYSGDIQKVLLAEEEEARKAEEQARKQAEEQGKTYIPSPGTDGQAGENLIVPTDGSTTDMASNAGVADMAGSGQAVPENDYIRPNAYMNRDNNAPAGEGAAADAPIPVQKTKSMTLEMSYESVTLYYYYQNVDNDISVTLTNPDGTRTYQPDSTTAGIAIFKLDSMEAGKWHVLIQGDAGTDHMRLYSENMETNEAVPSSDE